MRSAVAVAVIAGSAGLAAGCGSGAHGDTSAPAAARPQRAVAVAAFIRAAHRRTDTNGDGLVDWAEARAQIERDFRAADLTGDGVITVADVQHELDRDHHGRAARPLSSYLSFDTNADGRITEREYVAEVRRTLFGPMDANRDGKISADEDVAFETRKLRR